MKLARNAAWRERAVWGWALSLAGMVARYAVPSGLWPERFRPRGWRQLRAGA